MELTQLHFDWSALLYLLGLAALWGGIAQRLRELEKKVDKLASVTERLCRLEVTAQEQGKDIERVYAKIKERRTPAS